jgi:hypothetical protein
MSAVAATEAEIVQRIAQALTLPEQSLPKVEVRAWPDRPRDYRMTHPKGAALVIYRGSKFNHHATAGQLVSYEDEFELGLVSRSLRDAASKQDSTDAAEGVGIYDLLETCRNTLLGWTPQQASGQVRIVSVDFDDYVEGTWGYSLRFAIPMTTVANRPRPPGPWAVADDDNAPAMSQHGVQESSTL